ncbi:MAG: GWxTD domain-containing protein [bacterium]
MILLLTSLFLNQTIDFHVDPVIYLSTVTIEDTITKTVKQKDIFYIEFNCEIPYHELYYEESDSGIITRATIPFEIVNLDRADTLVDTLYRLFTLPSFSEAARQQMSFLIQFGLHILEGNFKYRISIMSKDKKGTVEKSLTINRADYPMSDILLAKEITTDTVGDYLKKGNLKIVPLPSHKFSERYTTLYLYYEIYDITVDTNELRVTYEIVNAQGEKVRQISQQVTKKYTSQAVNVGLNIAQFERGEYQLSIKIYNPSTESTIRKDISFEITKKVSEDMSYEDLPYYEKIDYFLKPGDYKKFQDLPDEGKKIFLQKFWSQHDYYKTAQRFVYADEHFKEGYKTGYETDRGRIYVKFGPYDEITTSVIEVWESKPYEMWEYSNGLRFVFVDIRSTAEFTLVWTNSTEEQSQPTLFDYLPESVKRELPAGTFD